MRKFLVTIVGVLLRAAVAKELRDQVNAAGSVLVPGCLFTDAKVVYGQQPGEVVLSAKVVADDHIMGSYWGDAEMTPTFIADYISGAGDLWVSRGDMFDPTCITVHQAA